MKAVSGLVEEALISHWVEIPDAESQQQDTTKAGQLLQIVVGKSFPTSP